MATFLFLLTQEGYVDELAFGSCVAEYVAEEVANLGHNVITITSPTPDDANTTISQYNPQVVWWIGHGWCCLTTLEKIVVWISTPKDECWLYGERAEGCVESLSEDVLNGRVACAVSCLTGQYLAPHLTTKRECISYLGYEEFFFFNYYPNCKCGCSIEGMRDEVVVAAMVCTHESNLFFILGLAQGMNVGEAYNYSLSRFDEWLEWWRGFEPVNEVEAAIARLTRLLLIMDRETQIVYGNLEYSIEVPPIPIKIYPIQFVIGMMGYPIMIGIGGMMK